MQLVPVKCGDFNGGETFLHGIFDILINFCGKGPSVYHGLDILFI